MGGNQATQTRMLGGITRPWPLGAGATLVAGLIGTFWIGIHGSYGQQFQVDGKITSSYVDSRGLLQNEVTSDFNVCVSNCAWVITITPTNKSEADYHRLSYDGGQLYIYTDAQTAISKMIAEMRSSGSVVPDKINLAHGCVVNSEVPHYMGANGAGQIWLTYASACYFQKNGSNLLDVPWIYGFGTNGEVVMVNDLAQCRGVWKIGRDSPQTPRSVLYFGDEFETFTNAVYESMTFTNLFGLLLPVESVFTVNTCVRDGSGNANTRVAYRFAVEAKSIRSSGSIGNFPPSVSALTMVTDHRFTSLTDPKPKTPVPYFVSERMLTREEAVGSKGYVDFKLKGKSDTNRFQLNQTSRFITRLTLAISCLGILFYLIKRLLNKTLSCQSSNKQNNENNNV